MKQRARSLAKVGTSSVGRLRVLSGRALGGPSRYPEKCTHRYCADTKVVFGRSPPLSTECTELLLPNNRFLIPAASRRKSFFEDVSSPSHPLRRSPIPLVAFAPWSSLCPRPFRIRSIPFSPLSPLLISRRYCAPLFRQFCPRRIVGVIDKTNKSAAHASE